MSGGTRARTISSFEPGSGSSGRGTRNTHELHWVSEIGFSGIRSGCAYSTSANLGMSLQRSLHEISQGDTVIACTLNQTISV